MTPDRDEEDWLSAEQRARVAALEHARDVLVTRTSSPIGGNSGAADPIDLVNVAGWIIDGINPWG